MANIKIAQLTNQTTISDTDLVIVESATSTNKMTVGKLKELLGIHGGGIVESGSNANGNYVKYADGTMICRNNAVVSGIPVSTVQGALYTSGNLEFDFPQPFLSAPTVSIIPRASATVLFAQQSGSASNIKLIYKISSPTSVTIESLIVNWIAIGRWK